MKNRKIKKFQIYPTNKCDINWNEYVIARNSYNKLIKAKKVNTLEKKLAAQVTTKNKCGNVSMV